MGSSQADIAVTVGVVLLCGVAALAGAPTAVMTVAGIALLAAPGYLWAKVILGPHVSGLERVAVSAGLSLAVPVLGGLALYAAGVALSRPAWIGLLAGVTLAGAAVLFALRAAGRAQACAWRPPGLHLPARHVAAFGAALVIAAGAMGLARAGAALQRRPAFTQLWLVSRNGLPPAADLGVSNHQNRPTRYRLVITRMGQASVAWNLTLASGQTWRRLIRFDGSPTLSADLYRLPDLTHPYRHVMTEDNGIP